MAHSLQPRGIRTILELSSAFSITGIKGRQCTNIQTGEANVLKIFREIDIHLHNGLDVFRRITLNQLILL